MSDDRFQAIVHTIAADFDTLRQRIDNRFEQAEQRFGILDQCLRRVDQRLARLEHRIAAIVMRLELLDQRMHRLEVRVGALEQHNEKIEFGLERIETSAIAPRAAIMERIDRLQNALWDLNQRRNRFAHVTERLEPKVDRMHDDLQDVKERLSILDTSLGSWAQMVGAKGIWLTRVDTRLTTIEERYDLRDGPQPGSDPTH